MCFRLAGDADQQHSTAWQVRGPRSFPGTNKHTNNKWMSSEEASLQLSAFWVLNGNIFVCSVLGNLIAPPSLKEEVEKQSSFEERLEFLCLWENGCFLYFLESSGVGCELNLSSMWSCFIIKNSTSQCWDLLSPRCVSPPWPPLYVQKSCQSIYSDLHLSSVFSLERDSQKQANQQWPSVNCFKSIHHFSSIRILCLPVVWFCFALEKPVTNLICTTYLCPFGAQLFSFLWFWWSYRCFWWFSSMILYSFHETYCLWNQLQWSPFNIWRTDQTLLPEAEEQDTTWILLRL